VRVSVCALALIFSSIFLAVGDARPDCLLGALADFFVWH
jgi:hypothetical protein